MNIFKKSLSPIDLITARNDRPVGKEVDKNQEIIEEELKNKNIGYEQMNVASVGPAVTTYSFRPAKNVRIQQVLDLINDFALALGVYPIRIEAPIPGTHFIGIEVPNVVKTVVGLREELTSDDYKKQPGELTICLGRNYENKSYYTNLAELPHALVAGSVNAGKSSFLKNIIIGFLVKHKPETLRLILIDAKRVEFPSFENIPHLLFPVITEVVKTIQVLNWCVDEMNRRFETLAKASDRNIVDYNKANKEKMPYIIIIIDELADLMVAAGKKAEANIIRLSQMARAVGIHMVLATQRPSVEIITGMIKANIPARFAFSTASSADSRAILDLTGAEKLLGQGDMLFTSAEIARPIRLQVPYISDEDVKKIVDHLRK